MQILGEISGLVTAILWSGSSMAFTNAAETIGSIQLNINRMIIACAFLFLTILIAGLSYQLTESQIIFLSLSGAVGLIFGDSFLFAAYRHVGARIGMLVMSLSPAMSALFAYFFLDEKLSLIAVTGIIITILGIGLVVLERSEISAAKYKISKIGIFYALMGALGQAGGLVLAKFAFNEGDINGFVATFVRVFSATVLMFIILLFVRGYKNPIKIYKANPGAFASTVLGTILGPYLGITTSLIAIKYTKVGIAATLMATVPIVMLPLVKFIYKEDLNWRATVGAFITVAGVAILFLR
jgi:drug/metabolite transporter (DMT)-like permease